MYDVTFQTEARYKSVKYGQGTIYSSACGPASLCNALKVLGIASVSLPTMCKLAVSCGARVTGGTDMHQLLRAASKKYAFAYRTTSKNAELLAHLKSGGTAILHAGTEYKLFSTSGYYLLSSPKQDAHPSEQEEPDMTYYKEFKDIPLYYQDAVKKLLDAGAIAGTGKGLELSEDLCRAFTILDKAGLLKL